MEKYDFILFIYTYKIPIMKKIKTKEKVSVALSEEIREYLKNNIENCSKYIEYLIYEDLIKNKVIEKKEYYSYEKNL